MDNLVIVGNGFDLNLGLKTSYRHFIDSVEFMKLLQNNNNILAQDLSNSFTSNLWIDVENELKTHCKNYPNPIQFKEHFTDLKVALMTYLRTIDTTKIIEDSHAYRLLQRIQGTTFLILDFNYTDTTEYILRKLNVDDSVIKRSLIKVHGSLANKDIIFGLEDSAPIDLLNHIYLKKSSAINFVGIDINNSLQSHTQVHLFGHSLGETDRTYFNNFFTSSLDYRPITMSDPRQRQLFIYHFGEDGWYNLARQIDAMTEQRLNIFRTHVNLTPIDASEQ